MTYARPSTDSTHADTVADEIITKNQDNVRAAIAAAQSSIEKEYKAVNLYITFDNVPRNIIGTTHGYELLHKSAQFVHDALHEAVGRTRTSILFHDWRYVDEETCRLTYTFYVMRR